MAKLVSNGELKIEEDHTDENKIDLAEILKITVTTSDKAMHQIEGNRTDSFK